MSLTYSGSCKVESRRCRGGCRIWFVEKHISSSLKSLLQSRLVHDRWNLNWNEKIQNFMPVSLHINYIQQISQLVNTYKRNDKSVITLINYKVIKGHINYTNDEFASNWTKQMFMLETFFLVNLSHSLTLELLCSYRSS